jgi:hypothetical protein
VGDGAAVRIYLSANTAGGLSTGRLLFVRLRCAARALLNVCLVGRPVIPAAISQNPLAWEGMRRRVVSGGMRLFRYLGHLVVLLLSFTPNK